jgi:hypothetical protein
MTDIRGPRDDAQDPALDHLLRESTPPPVADDGFTARVMHAVRRAADARAAAARPPERGAQALAGELGRHAAQRRLWRWSLGGTAAGAAALALATLGAPAVEEPFLDAMAALPSGPAPWLSVWGTAFAAAAWLVVRALRSEDY